MGNTIHLYFRKQRSLWALFLIAVFRGELLRNWGTEGRKEWTVLKEIENDNGI